MALSRPYSSNDVGCGGSQAKTIDRTEADQEELRPGRAWRSGFGSQWTWHLFKRSSALHLFAVHFGTLQVQRLRARRLVMLA